MSHYDFPTAFRAAYDKAVARYKEGRRSAAELLDPEDVAWLASNGITPQHLYDYAEDDSGYGEPGFEQALAIELVRRDYFLNAQGGRPSTKVLDMSSLPAKTDAVDGISWLPRLIPKARAKLRGELPPTLMYCCGGDRAFFQERNILPSEFLHIVWHHEKDAEIVAWTKSRSKRNL